jgi:hypothetical protein
MARVETEQPSTSDLGRWVVMFGLPWLCGARGSCSAVPGWRARLGPLDPSKVTEANLVVDRQHIPIPLAERPLPTHQCPQRLVHAVHAQSPTVGVSDPQRSIRNRVACTLRTKPAERGPLGSASDRGLGNGPHVGPAETAEASEMGVVRFCVLLMPPCWW